MNLKQHLRSSPIRLAVVAEPGFAGVVAERRRQAYEALAALELGWSDGVRFDDAELERLATVIDGEGVVIQRKGRVGRNLGRGRALRAEYRSALAAHAHLEPQAAVVDVRPDRVEAWVPTQSPDSMRSALAERLGFTHAWLYDSQMICADPHQCLFRSI